MKTNRKMIKKIQAGIWMSAVMLGMILSTAVPVLAASKETDIQFKKAAVYLYEGQRTGLKLTGDTGEKLVWASADKKVVRVSQKGSVRAVSAGVAAVTVRNKANTWSASCQIKVGKYITEMQLLSAENVLLKEGEESRIETEMKPARVFSQKIICRSSDEEVVTVDSKGRITAKKEGQAVITVTSKAKTEDGIKLEKQVRVCVLAADKSETGTETGTGGAAGGSSGGAGTEDTGTEDTAAAEPVAAIWTSGNQTTYVLNKNYAGTVTATISVDGRSWTQTGTTSSILDNLENTWMTKENSAGTIRVSRPVGADWWTVTDPAAGTVLFRVKAVTSGGNASQGQIIVEQVGGSVDVSIQ